MCEALLIRSHTPRGNAWLSMQDEGELKGMNSDGDCWN